MVTLYDFKTKRTITLKDTDRVQREVLQRAGWVVRETTPEATAPEQPASEKETPPPPVLATPEGETNTALNMGGVFVVSPEDQGGSPYVVIAAEKGGAENFLGGDFEDSDARKSGDAENFGGSDFAGDGGAVAEGGAVTGVEEVTEGDRADLKDLETEPKAAVEAIPEPVEEKKKGRGRGRPAGSGKGPAHTWEGNLRE